MSNKIKKTVSLLTLFSLLFGMTGLLSSCNDKKKIERKSDTEYVILMISDTHIENNASYYKKLFKTMDDLMTISSPDFVVMAGDLTHIDENDAAFKTFAEKMEGYQVPWTFTFGNHDAMGSAWTKKDIADYLESLDYCQFKKGDEDVYGYGNQYFNVTDKNGKVIQTIFTMDTSGPEGGTHAIEESQLDWYRRSVIKIATDVNGDPNVVVPSILFAHIPMQEYIQAYSTAKKNGTVLHGKRKEKECPAAEADQLFETLREVGSTTAYYCGHEHKNNYSVEWDGIRLSYNETMRHEFYIPSRGGLVINVKSDGKVTQQNIRRSLASSIYHISEEY